MYQDASNRANPYGDDKVMAACSIFGMLDTSGKRVSGEGVIRAIANMHDRSNGLGGGFAIYGLYPELADQYAVQIMFGNRSDQIEIEEQLRRNFDVVFEEDIPTRRKARVVKPPLLRRYFVDVGGRAMPDETDDDYVVQRVMEINAGPRDACVFSSGKDMGVFKGVGYPEDVADYFRLEDYKGYLWTAHGRFPTNSQAWWGGAHPFSLLDLTVVHNGDISSYGANRRYLEMYDYQCTLHTDTEVIAYALDLLMRRHTLPIEIAAKVLAAPLWTEIERLSPTERALYTALRQTYGSLLMNGPVTIIIARRGELIGLTDRIRLRPLTAATKGDVFYLSSEESAIRLISPELDRTWIPVGGQPLVARVQTSVTAEREVELVA
jgi:glutamate synthase domain-containing protein 1